LYCFSYYSQYQCLPKLIMSEHTHGLEGLGHDLWPVVNGQYNVRHASTGQSLNLVLDHGLVGEFNERLRVCEGLHMVSLQVSVLRGLQER
jgi:hypothetical protein